MQIDIVQGLFLFPKTLLIIPVSKAHYSLSRNLQQT